MAKSSARGASTSVEVVAMTPHALWLLVGGNEYMLDYVQFPWFRDATIAEVQNVELRFGHLHWPALDVDLHMDSIVDPGHFPLVARGA